MVRVLTIGTLALCVLGGLGAADRQPPQQQPKEQPPAQDTQPVFRSRGDTVRVFVTVTDRDGRLVTALAKDDFEVRDEGAPQTITTFDNSPQPVRLIVMLDVSGSMEGNLPLLRAAADQLFPRLAAEDVARVGAFGHEITISETFTRDPRALRAGIPEFIAPDAPTPLWRALDKAMNAFKEDRDRGQDQRAAILVLSDGKDSGPIGFSLREPMTSQVQVIERARNEDVMIYAVGMRSRMRPQGPPGIGQGGLQAMMTRDLPDPGLARVAEETGGGYTEIKFSDDLGAAFARVVDELHSQYLLGYAPPKRDGKVHKIDVKLAKGGGMKPRARRSYVAAKG